MPGRLWRETFNRLLDHDDVEGLDRLEVPVLLLWGEHDALFPRVDQDRLAAAIPDATLVVYPHVGHCPNWECPEQVAADIRAFAATR
jgi:pimeloyl-ACP methyl ester carboxylesterase